MAPEAQRTIPNTQFQKPPKKKLIFAAILAAGLCLGSATKPSPIPENPYAFFPVARIRPNPYTVCERKSGICAPRIFITQKKDLRAHNVLDKEQMKTFRQLETGEILNKLKWLYEGTPVEGAISEFPPFAFEMDLAPRNGAALSSGWGMQLLNTNAAALDFGDSTRISEQNLILAHELIHYISWLGSGWEASYLFEGEKISTMSPVWLQEGITNWASCRTPGFSCVLDREGNGLKNYHEETYLAVFLETLSGKEALRRAAVSGDFTQVQYALDNAVGKGTFEQAADAESVSDALSLLAVKTNCFTEPAANSVSGDPFTANALAFLQNVSKILLKGFCGQK